MGDWKVIVPEATRNLIANPSIEVDASGYTASGTNTIARTADQSFKGDYSLSITFGNDNTLATIAALLTAVPHTFTARVYIPAAWNGGPISLDISGFASATVQAASNSASIPDTWAELTMTFTPDAGDLSGNLMIKTNTSPTVGRLIYLDAVQVEAKAYATTYCDGDQEACSWDGTPHASTSRRQANSRAGGRVMDLEDDFGFRVQHEPGAGFAPVDNISNERVTLPGAEFQRARLTSRTFALSGTIIGDTPEDLKARRAALIPVFSPFAYDGGPVTLRYTGAAVDKEIRGRYAGGLEWDKVIWRYEQAAIVLWAEDPRFLALGENSEELLVGTITTRLILGKIGGVWSDLGPPDAAGTYTSIRDIKPGPDGKIYVCGVFLNFDNVAAADYIARYDPVNDVWEAVGSPNSGVGVSITNILKMAFGPDGTLYVVGTFVNLAGVANADYIAKWNGSAWSAVGNPNSGGAAITNIKAVAYGWRGQLWVGGDFANLAGLAAADNIAYYQVDTGTWTAPGASGADGDIKDIWAHPFVDLLYVGGQFDTIAGVASTNVIKREMGDWVVMAGLTSDDPVNRLLATNGLLYMAGEEVTDLSLIAAVWAGAGWKPLGDALDDSAYALAQMATGEIIVGGAFENIVSVLGEQLVEAKAVAYWNQSIWSPPEFDLPGTPTVYAAAALPNGDVYLGYDTAGDTEVPATTTITNNGTAPAWPIFVITITGGASSPLLAIENATTGKRVSFSYELEPGRTVWIDLRPESFGMYHQAPDGSGAGRFFRFGPDSGLADWFLRPGDNDINLYTELKSGAVLAATVRWVDSYESIDG